MGIAWAFFVLTIIFHNKSIKKSQNILNFFALLLMHLV
jgi:hypothetical protein